MLRRDDFKFFATALGLAMILHTCDWAIGQAFKSWAEQFDVKENVPVQLEYSPRKSITPLRQELSDSMRMARCKKSAECSKLAEALVYEARGESFIGAVAVGYVIVERTKNPAKWAATIRGVIDEPKQFSYTTHRQKVKPRAEDWERAYIASFQVLKREVGNPTDAADHYHTDKVNPVWAKNMQYVATIGSHKFYKDIQ